MGREILHPHLPAEAVRLLIPYIPGLLIIGTFALLVGIASGRLWFLSIIPFALVFAVIVLMCSVFFVFALLNLRETRYRIVKEGIHFNEGFLTQQEKFLPLEKITDVRLIRHWPIDTYFGTGQIILETAGFLSSLRLRTIRHPREVYEQIKDMLVQDQPRRREIR